MSCGWRERVDVGDYVLDPADERWQSFREHFAECDECSREVASWSTVECALLELAPGTASDASQHIAPELLARFSESGSRLAAGEREDVAKHLAGCRQCATELRALERFAGGTSRASAAVAEATSRVSSLSDWLDAIRDFFGRPVLAIPAIAIVLLALLLAPDLWRSSGSRGDAADDRVADAAPAAETDPASERVEEQLASDSARLPDSTPVSEAVDNAAGELASTGGAAALGGEREPVVASVGPASPERRPSANPDLVGEVMERPPEPLTDAPIAANPDDTQLLAALTELGAPHYLPPDPLVGIHDDHVAMRATPNENALTALAPRHVAMTYAASPVLWWTLAADSTRPIEITVTSEDAIEPVFETRLAPPLSAGRHAISLQDAGVELEMGRPYRWHVALILDEARRSRDIVASGAVQRIPAAKDDSRLASPARGHVLAEKGVWYDAIDYFEQLVRQHPSDQGLRDQRDALIRSARVE